MSTEITPLKFRDPFSVKDFVEKVSRQTAVSFSSEAEGKGDAGGHSGAVASFDPSPLLEEFENTVSDLWALHTHVAGEVARLEQNLKQEEEDHAQTVQELDRWMTEGFESLKGLGAGVNDVATKVVHVGDQLEVVKAKRFRAEDAAKLMKHFATFREEDSQMLPPFDTLDDLHEAADIIQKLHFIALELPTNERFFIAKQRIEDSFLEIEQLLLREFEQAFGNRKTMRTYAHTLFPFQKAHATCIQNFIAQFVDKEMPLPSEASLYEDIIELCDKAHAMIEAVFRSPHAVFLTFIQEGVGSVIKHHVSRFLQREGVSYLDTLHKHHKRTQELLAELAKQFDVGLEHVEDKTLGLVFQDFLRAYIDLEEELLMASYSDILTTFFESIGHVKRPVKEVKGIPASDETYLSLEVTLSMIHENQAAMTRCADLASSAELPDWAYRIFRRLLDGLCLEHVEYGLTIATEHLPPKKPKSQPSNKFFRVVHDVNSIFYLLQKHFWDCILPAVRSSLEVYPACVNRKNEIMERFEGVLSDGLDRSLESIVEWLSHILAKDQKKSDFRPGDDAMAEVISGSSTLACQRCVAFLQNQVKEIKACLNGKNLDFILQELGSRFYRVLLDHIKGLTINTLGGMLLTRDLTEYEKGIHIFGDSALSVRFLALRELSALTIVKAENIKQLCEEKRANHIGKEELSAFLHLRSDYKSAKLGALVK